MFEEMKIRYFIGVTILISLSFYWILTRFDIPEELSPEFEVTAILFFGFYFYKQKTSIHMVLNDKDLYRWFPTLILMALLVNTFSLTIFWYQLYLLDHTNLILEFPSDPVVVSSFYIIIKMIMTTVTGPITEEFIFRGLLLNRLIKKTNMWVGILISSILFAVIHFDYELLIATFLFSIIASLLYLKTRNLLFPILLHMFHNSIVFIQTTIFPSWQEFISVLTYSNLHTNVVFKSTLLVITSFLMVVSIVYLAKDKRTKAISMS